MLPTRASTRRSWTSSPKRPRTSAPIESPSSGRGQQRLERGARLAAPRQQRGCGPGATHVGGHAEQQPVGDRVQAVAPDGRRRRRSATSARRRGRRRRRARWRAGTRARNASAPSSTAGSPANGDVRILPPRRSSASQHARSSASGRSRRERVRRGQPGDPAADDDDARRHRWRQRRRTRSASARRSRSGRRSRRRAGEGQPARLGALARPRCRGRRAPRGGRRRSRTGRRAAPSTSAVGGQLVDDVEDVGAEPRLGRAAGRLPADRPPVVVEPEPARRRPRRWRAARPGTGRRRRGCARGSEWAVNTTLVSRRQRRQPRRRRRRRGSRRTPARSPSSRRRRTATPAASAAAPARPRYSPIDIAE